MLKRIIIVLILLSLFFGALFGWKFYLLQQIGRKMAQVPPAVVSVSVVTRETWQPHLASVGSLAASKGVWVSNEVEGIVSEIFFESGEKVEDGQVLVQLDDSVARAELKGLLARQRMAELDLQRDVRLRKQKYVSESEYDRAQTELEHTTAQVAAKRALIAKKKIRAPFAGWLGIRQVNKGQYLAPGTRIVALESLDPIYADYSLPERHLARVRIGQPVEVEVQAFPDRFFKGSISAISPRIEAATRSVKIRAILDNREGRLRPGMFAGVRTLLPVRQDVLTLPRIAIGYAPYGDTVFVVRKEAERLTVQRVPIVTGEVRGQRVEIVQGLEAGQQVVSAGQVKLRNGMAVRIDNSIRLPEAVSGP